MWNSIKNTTEFVHSQIPQLIKFIYDKNIKEVYEKYYLIYNVDEIDFSVVTSVYVNIIGGVLLAIGLRFAGTGD
jgi:anaphase-promoting complex subunit 1